MSLNCYDPDQEWFDTLGLGRGDLVSDPELKVPAKHAGEGLWQWRRVKRECSWEI